MPSADACGSSLRLGLGGRPTAGARAAQTNARLAPGAPPSLTAQGRRRPLSFAHYLARTRESQPHNAIERQSFSSPTMAAAAVDVGYLAASYAVPETTLNTLLDAPTVELVQSLLVQIEAKAREHDDLKSEKLRSDVELEAAIHNADTRVRTLKATADKAERDVDELRQKLAQQGKSFHCVIGPMNGLLVLTVLPQKPPASRPNLSCRLCKPKRERRPPAFTNSSLA